MKGYKVDRKIGLDCNGLPIEYNVEKKLGINGKKDIEEMGRKAYINSQKSNHDRKAINRSDINCSINSKNCKRILIKDETIYKLSKSVDSADNNKTVDNKEVIFLKKDNTKDSNIKIQDNKVITDKKVYNLKPTKNNIYNLKKPIMIR